MHRLHVAAFLFVAPSRNLIEAEQISVPWLLYTIAVIVISGTVNFLMKHYALSVPRATFLVYWYIGGVVGGFLLNRAERAKITFNQAEVLNVGVVSVGVVASLATAYWALELAPLGLVAPLFSVGSVVVPLFVGLIFFNERKQLSLTAKIAFLVAVAGLAAMFISQF